MSEKDRLDEARVIIEDLVAELKRRDIQWGSRAYSHAVQFLRYLDDDKAQNRS